MRCSPKTSKQGSLKACMLQSDKKAGPTKKSRLPGMKATCNRCALCRKTCAQRCKKGSVSAASSPTQTSNRSPRISTASAGVFAMYCHQASKVAGSEACRCRSEIKSTVCHAVGAVSRPSVGAVVRGSADTGSAHHSATAFSITTSSLGTSPWPPRLPVFTPLIWSTTSVPLTTLPNTA